MVQAKGLQAVAPGPHVARLALSIGRMVKMCLWDLVNLFSTKKKMFEVTDHSFSQVDEKRVGFWGLKVTKHLVNSELATEYCNIFLFFFLV